MGFSASVDASGPVFNGAARREVTKFQSHIRNVLGDHAVALIRHYLPTQYMYLGHNGGTPKFNPVPGNAGYYQSVIHTIQVADAVLVHDTPSVYGPWLEGVGSRNPVVWPHKRNPPPRRFEGYHSFRKMAQVLNTQATGIANKEIQPYIGAMNA